MANPLPEDVRRQAWDLLRPYKEVRLKVKEIVPLPPFIGPVVGNWSVKLGAVFGRMFGSDRWSTD